MKTNKQFQGSKKKARKLAYLQRRAALESARQEVEELKDRWKYNQLKKIDKMVEDLQAENAALKAWKESQLEVEKSWNVQTVAKEIGVGLGKDIRAYILPFIKKVKEENAALNKENSEMARMLAEPAGWQVELHKLREDNAALRKRLEPVEATYQKVCHVNYTDSGIEMWQAICRAVEGAE